MIGRVRAMTAHASEPLAGGWQICSTPAGAIDGPEALERAGVSWLSVPGPTTAAASLRAAGRWSLDGPPRRFDAEDWWWRVELSAAGDGQAALCLDGLATLSDVWLDGAHLLAGDNMFVAHRRRVPPGDHQLLIRCRSLDAALTARRPRPRWRAPMVENQQLRWMRTTLLGRTPGWSPPAAPVGPWRPVRLERSALLLADEVRVFSRDGGRLEIECRLTSLADPLGEVDLVLSRGGAERRVRLSPEAGGGPLRGALELPVEERWWPHTHGEPALHDARLELRVGARDCVVELGPVGLRQLALDTSGGGFGLAVNGVPVFCRGACWTPLDPVSLAAGRDELRLALTQARDAGMNMLRVCGPMVYESDDFYDLADELGLLVWQDFMFANLDYPEDEGFIASVSEEARQLLGRLAGRPSLAVLCGNSEVEQQAAMWGAPRALWQPRLFHDNLAGLARAACPDVPYWPSSAHGGAFPHQVDAGTTSYYGVGAYLRPPDDARLSGARFASECLGFANLPSAAGLAEVPGGPSLRVHHPAWKARVPRDLGAGWDFDDVRDHYLAGLYGVDPSALRYADHDRYLALGRAVTGELMARAFGEWRRAQSSCRGALVWFLRDLWAGAGWGVIDAGGRPKPAWWFLRRALSSPYLHLGAEGCNGIVVHLAEERGAPLAAELELVAYLGEAQVARGSRAVDLPGRGSLTLNAGELLDGFFDLTHAYRFGPPTCDLIAATLRAAGGATLARAYHLPLGPPASIVHDLGLAAEARARADGDLDLEVRSQRHAHAVTVEVDGFAPEDDWFTLAPGEARTIRLLRLPAVRRAARGSLQALNGAAAARFQVPA